MKKNFFVWCALIFATFVQAQHEKPAGAIRFMTYNVSYCRGFDSYQNGSKTNPYNTQRIGKIIKALDPDVVALQELDSGNINKRFLLDDIRKATGVDYQVIYGASDKADVGNYGVGILIKRNIPVLDIKKKKLPGTVYGSNPVIKNNDRLLLRIMTENFYFNCTHLDLNTEQRVNSAAIINNELDYLRKPSFLAGDLNDSHRWNGGAFTEFFNETWDIFSTLEYTISEPENHSTIDYILYYNYNNKNLYKSVGSRAVRGMLEIPGESPIQVEYASDHLPVYADVIFNNPSSTEILNSDEVKIIQEKDCIRFEGLEEGLYEVIISQLSGKTIYSSQVSNIVPIEINKLMKGPYLIRLTKGYQYLCRKIII